MNDPQSSSQYQQGMYEREDRDRRDEHYPQQPSFSQPPPGSPPHSASPFAFAPPPLSSNPGPGSTSRPHLPMHNSEPIPGAAASYNNSPSSNYFPKPPPVPQHHNSYPSYGAQQQQQQSQPIAPPMGTNGYRSYSNDTRQSPATMNRTPSLTHLPTPGGSGAVPSQASPSTGPASSPYIYGRGAPPSYSPALPSPQRSSPLYPPHQAPYYSQQYSQPTSADMPRSMSYPSAYGQQQQPQQSYPSYPTSMSTPSLLSHHSGSMPPLMRYNTTMGIGEGIAGMDIRQGPSMGYAFANRLPLVDRPFKCDECVQSFNRNHDLKRHKRIHLSVKPFGCDKCGKTFSRKDALRRHWLVKGCRGEEGATAVITPMFPLNTQPPALSPPTPPGVSPIEQYAPSSDGHPGAPPPLNTLPHRQASDQSTMIVTPTNGLLSTAQSQALGRSASSHEEPLVVDTGLGSARGSEDSQSSYFDGVVGLKQDGTAVLDKSMPSPYNAHRHNPASPSMVMHPHPYRRPSAMPSPSRGSPTHPHPQQHHHQQHQQHQPSQHHYQQAAAASALGPDGKPVFAMPFAPSQGGYVDQDGMLAPPHHSGDGVKMEKSMSSQSVDADGTTWQRWHRPSFPFPAPPGINYNFEPSSPADATYAQ